MVQVETAVKNEQIAEVEAVNFLKVELKEEFGGNILSDAEKTSINPTAEVLKNEKQCPFCEKQFRNSSNLKNHINTHKNERPFIFLSVST